jgi:hypothetical protein
MWQFQCASRCTLQACSNASDAAGRECNFQRVAASHGRNLYSRGALTGGKTKETTTMNFTFKPMGANLIYTSKHPTLPPKRVENAENIPINEKQTVEKCINVIVANILWSNPSKMIHFVCGKCGGSKLESLVQFQEREYTAKVVLQRERKDVGQVAPGEGKSQRARRRKRKKKETGDVKMTDATHALAQQTPLPQESKESKATSKETKWTSNQTRETREMGKEEVYCLKCNAVQSAVYNYRLQIAITPIGTPKMHITLPPPKIDLPESISVYHQAYEPRMEKRTSFSSPEEALKAASQPDLYLDQTHQQVMPLMVYNQQVERDLTSFSAGQYEEMTMRANVSGMDLHSLFSKSLQLAGPWMIQLSPVNDWLVKNSLSSGFLKDRHVASLRPMFPQRWKPFKETCRTLGLCE